MLNNKQYIGLCEYKPADITIIIFLKYKNGVLINPITFIFMLRPHIKDFIAPTLFFGPFVYLFIKYTEKGTITKINKEVITESI